VFALRESANSRKPSDVAKRLSLAKWGDGPDGWLYPIARRVLPPSKVSHEHSSFGVLTVFVVIIVIVVSVKALVMSYAYEIGRVVCQT
jgi:hypothetical protein